VGKTTAGHENNRERGRLHVVVVVAVKTTWMCFLAFFLADVVANAIPIVPAMKLLGRECTAGTP
jgi:hypothetical protein